MLRSTRTLRQAASVDWSRIYNSLGLKKETVSALQTFRKRHEDGRRNLSLLEGQKTDIDFSHYRQVIKNTAIVDEIEKAVKGHKPTTYDVSAQIKNIEAFEAKAIASAKEAAQKIDEELKALQSTLTNIEEARSFDELTVDDVANARKDLDQVMEKLMAKGKFSIPGYREKFGDVSIL